MVFKVDYTYISLDKKKCQDYTCLVKASSLDSAKEIVNGWAYEPDKIKISNVKESKVK